MTIRLVDAALQHFQRQNLDDETRKNFLKNLHSQLKDIGFSEWLTPEGYYCTTDFKSCYDEIIGERDKPFTLEISGQNLTAVGSWMPLQNAVIRVNNMGDIKFKTLEKQAADNANIFEKKETVVIAVEWPDRDAIVRAMFNWVNKHGTDEIRKNLVTKTFMPFFLRPR